MSKGTLGLLAGAALIALGGCAQQNAFGEMSAAELADLLGQRQDDSDAAIASPGPSQPVAEAPAPAAGPSTDQDDGPGADGPGDDGDNGNDGGRNGNEGDDGAGGNGVGNGGNGNNGGNGGGTEEMVTEAATAVAMEETATATMAATTAAATEEMEMAAGTAMATTISQGVRGRAAPADRRAASDRDGRWPGRACEDVALRRPAGAQPEPVTGCAPEGWLARTCIGPKSLKRNAIATRSRGP